FGEPPSMAHDVFAPASSATSMWIHECGLMSSTFVTVPFSDTGFSTVNSAAKAWCALAGPPLPSTTAPSSAAPAAPAAPRSARAAVGGAAVVIVVLIVGCSGFNEWSGAAPSARRCLGLGARFVGACAAQQVCETVIALVAGVLEQRAV